MLILFNTLAKILFRLGLDAAFFRVYYDLESDEQKRRLAGTTALLAAAVGSVFFGAIVLGAESLARLLFGHEQAPAELLVLSALDVYLGVFAFVPLKVLQIQDRPGLFSTFSAVRHTVNTVLKVALVVKGYGVAGVVMSDAVASAVFSLSLLPVLLRNASLSFSPALLRELLRFGLPKVPHGLMLQAQNFADRKILDLYVTRDVVGVYQMGYTFGQAVKFALSAFEPAWAPFVYAQIQKPGARETLARVVTYAWGGFVALALVVAVLARELLQVMTFKNPAFWAAAPVVPVVVLAYLLQGAFLLTSIGIGIEKRARYYPAVTAAAVAANLIANVILIPRFGMMGAAWATVLAYAVMALMGLWFSQRVYPIPFEWRRLTRLALAALGVYAVSRLAPQALLPALAFKSVVLASAPFLAAAIGGLHAEERTWLMVEWKRIFSRRS